MTTFKRPRHPDESLTFAQWYFEMIMMEVRFHIAMSSQIGLDKKSVKRNIVELIAKARYLYYVQMLSDMDRLEILHPEDDGGCEDS